MNPSGLTWRKFGRSTNGGTSLLRSLSPVVVAWIRDSKDSNSWSLTFSRVRWFAFTKGVRAGQFD
jgi:hypothetical protein